MVETSEDAIKAFFQELEVLAIKNKNKIRFSRTPDLAYMWIPEENILIMRFFGGMELPMVISKERSEKEKITEVPSQRAEENVEEKIANILSQNSSRLQAFFTLAKKILLSEPINTFSLSQWIPLRLLQQFNIVKYTTKNSTILIQQVDWQKMIKVLEKVQDLPYNTKNRILFLYKVKQQIMEGKLPQKVLDLLLEISPPAYNRSNIKKLYSILKEINSNGKYVFRQNRPLTIPKFLQILAKENAIEIKMSLDGLSGFTLEVRKGKDEILFEWVFKYLEVWGI